MVSPRESSSASSGSHFGAKRSMVGWVRPELRVVDFKTATNYIVRCACSGDAGAGTVDGDFWHQRKKT